jgi:hypothetical protein
MHTEPTHDPTPMRPPEPGPTPLPPPERDPPQFPEHDAGDARRDGRWAAELPLDGVIFDENGVPG